MKGYTFLLALAIAGLVSTGVECLSTEITCAACEKFVPHLLEVADIADKHHTETFAKYEQATALDMKARADADDGVVVPETETVDYSTEQAHEDIKYEHQLCDKAFFEDGDEHWAEACHDIVDTYGLDTVESLIQSAPSTLCAHVKACRQEHSYKEETLDEYSDVLVGVGSWSELLGGGGLQKTGLQPEEKEALNQPGAGGSNGQGMASMMFQQQAMEQQSKQEQQVNNALRKIRRAEARNRALRRDLRELRKETWRSKPGNCDCCDACLPPVTAVADKA